MEALVIVHLSSLDAFTALVGEKEGWELARHLAVAVRDNPGWVFVADQGWDDDRPESAPRQWLISEIEGIPRITWIRFDEDLQPWEPFLRQLRKLLEARDIQKVWIGGVWYDPALKGGCATAVYLYLKKYFDANVVPELVGCEP